MIGNSVRQKRSKDWPGSNDNFFKAIDGLLYQSSVIIASISTNQASTLTHTRHFHFIINNYKKVTRARALLLHQAYIIIYIIYYSSNSTNNCQCSPSMTSSGGGCKVLVHSTVVPCGVLLLPAVSHTGLG